MTETSGSDNVILRIVSHRFHLSAFDPKRPFFEMQQERKFWLYILV